jgi:hypothetical protein
MTSAMSPSRPERRRRARLREPVDPVDPELDDLDEDEADEPRHAARGLVRRFRPQSNVIWALVTGLAVGYAVGREMDRFGGRAPADDQASGKSKSGGSGKVYANVSEFPAGWTKHTQLTTHAGIFSGLSDAQAAAAMHALNERNCECGCTFGTLANCLDKDPNCPRSPVIARLAADLAKQDKPASEIIEAIDAKQKEMGGNKAPAAQPAPPAGVPQKIALAAHNPRKGPKDPKVTIVEFSDFQ